MTNPNGDPSHQTERATPETVAILGQAAANLVVVSGTPWEYVPHMVCLKREDFPADLIPEGARPFLRFGDLPVTYEVTTDTRTGLSNAKFTQLYAPDGYPGYFKDMVRYDLSGDGQTTAEATFMNIDLILETPNPDHSGQQIPYIQQPDAEQLSRLLKIA